MPNPLLENDLTFLPDRMIQTIHSAQDAHLDNSLIERSLDTPDWTLDQLWQAAVYFHLRMFLDKAMKYYHRLLQWAQHDNGMQSDILQAISHVFLLSELPQDALNTLQRAQKMRADAKIYFYLAECHRLLNQPQQEKLSWMAFIESHTSPDAMLSLAYSKLIQHFDASGLWQEAQELCQAAAHRLDSWAFAFQARHYQPLLPAAPVLPAVDGELDGQRVFLDEFSENYLYRICWRTAAPLAQLSAAGDFVAERMNRFLPQAEIASQRSASSGRRIVVVGNFANPDHAPYLDVLVELCRRHSVTLISTGSLPPRLLEEDWLRQIQTNDSVMHVYRAIQNHAPDLLIYTEVGPRSPAAYMLASLRLAPIQAVMGLYPLSSGLANLDHYLSFDWLEAEEAQAEYRERLHRLAGTPALSPGLPDRFIPRERFNLPATCRHYLLPLTCASLHADYLPQLAEILRLDPQGQILLPSYDPAIDARFREFFAADWGECVQRVHFLPPMSRLALLSLCREADVLLDPMYIGLSYSLWQLIPLGTPIVTWEAPQARGRYAAGLYRQLGVTDSLAPTPLAYAETAVRLAQNAQFKAEFREKVAASQQQMFQHQVYLASLEAFISQVLDTPVAG